MDYIDESELPTHDIVANATMNRGRGLSGVNSYERELRINPVDWLLTEVQSIMSRLWIDLCCGEGRALNQAASGLKLRTPGYTIEIVGVDLIDAFVEPADNVRFCASDVLEWSWPQQNADLLTCVHGLHYIGDKLRVLEDIHAHLEPGGVFFGQMDLHNIVIDDVPVKSLAALKSHSSKPAASDLKFQRGLLTMARPSVRELCFTLRYLGARPSTVPHSSGIQVIDSFYSTDL